MAACEQFLGKSEDEITQVALETLEGHQRAIMGSMTVEVKADIVINNNLFLNLREIVTKIYLNQSKVHSTTDDQNLAHMFLLNTMS